MKIRLGILIATASLATLPACAHGPADTPAGHERSAPGRLMPASGLICPRDQLTSYNGQVRDYLRRDSHLRLEIDTDWDTRETVHLDLPPAALKAQLRIDGEAFDDDDWSRVESEPGALRTDIRVIAWVCSDARILPVIDWRTSPTP